MMATVKYVPWGGGRDGDTWMLLGAMPYIFASFILICILSINEDKTEHESELGDKQINESNTNINEHEHEYKHEHEHKHEHKRTRTRTRI